MKAICFEKPLQFTLDVAGEKWSQGDHITGKLEIENHSDQKISLENAGVQFAYGDLKKIKNKAPDMFLSIEKFVPTAKEINGKEKISFSWKASLDENSAISDKQGAFYLIYGNLQKEVPDRLQLLVHPSERLRLMMEMFERFYRFKVKEWKSTKKNSVECKLIPPVSKDFSNMEELSIIFSQSTEELKMHFTANLQVLGANTLGVKIRKEKKAMEVTWESAKYLLNGKFFNQDYILKEYGNIVEQIKMKVF